MTSFMNGYSPTITSVRPLERKRFGHVDTRFAVAEGVVSDETIRWTAVL